MDLNAVMLLISVCSALGGALGTYVLARIDRAQMLRTLETMQTQRTRDRAQLVFALTMLSDIANKNGFSERFSTGIMRVLSFTPTEGSDEQFDIDAKQ
jgi:hypothetical protein